LDRFISSSLFSDFFFSLLLRLFFFRFPDTASRNAWHEVFGNAVLYHNNGKSSTHQNVNTFSWLSTAFTHTKKTKANATGSSASDNPNNKTSKNPKVIVASRGKSRKVIS
jgi:hypothetical protein